MHLFTLVQVGFFALAWVLNGLAMSDPTLSPLGLCFPVVIMLIVPFRIYVMPRFFDAKDLELLDAEKEAASTSEQGILERSQDAGMLALSFGRTPQKGEMKEGAQGNAEEKQGDELYSVSA